MKAHFFNVPCIRLSSLQAGPDGEYSTKREKKTSGWEGITTTMIGNLEGKSGGL